MKPLRDKISSSKYKSTIEEFTYAKISPIYNSNITIFSLLVTRCLFIERYYTPASNN